MLLIVYFLCSTGLLLLLCIYIYFVDWMNFVVVVLFDGFVVVLLDDLDRYNRDCCFGEYL